MIFRTPIEKPSSRHPHSGWDFYQHMISSRWHGAPPKIDRVYHAKAQGLRSRATSRHTVGIRRLPVIKPGPWVGPSVPSKSASGHGPLINPFG